MHSLAPPLCSADFKSANAVLSWYTMRLMWTILCSKRCDTTLSHEALAGCSVETLAGRLRDESRLARNVLCESRPAEQ
jgi:hypothetical protein